MQEIRAHAVTAETQPSADATLAFIGRIATPWTRREDCPRQSAVDTPACAIVAGPRG